MIHDDDRLTHSVCDLCWRVLEGDREPFRMAAIDPKTFLPTAAPPEEVCCSCGQLTTSGIYQRTGGARKYCVYPEGVQ